MNGYKKIMKYGLMNELYGSLYRLSTLTGKPGIAIARTRISMRPHIEVFEQVRKNLFEKYGTKNEQGYIVVDQNNPNNRNFVDEMNSLLNEEAEITIYQIQEEEFDIDNMLCEEARAKDYELFELLMVEKNAGKSENNA